MEERTTLYYILDSRGIEQSAVSKGTGISQVTLSRYVSGKRIPTLRNALRISGYLGVSVETIWREIV